MKKIILSIAMLLGIATAQAQHKTWEHNIFASAGIQIDGDEDIGSSTRIGYGLSYYFTEHFSLMPAIALRHDAENMFAPTDGNSDEGAFTFLDIPVMAQYHVRKWTFALGPVFSFCVKNDNYYIDADPNDPLNGMSRLKTFGLGLQPSIMHGSKFRFGIEGNIGLLNMKDTHGLTSGTQRFSNLVLTIGYRF